MVIKRVNNFARGLILALSYIVQRFIAIGTDTDLTVSTKNLAVILLAGMKEKFKYSGSKSTSGS